MSGEHLINKQRFELRLTRHGDAHRIQGDISRVNSETLLPAFEKLFDRLTGSDQLIRLGTTELDVGCVSRQELFSDGFLARLIGLLEKAIVRARDRSASPAIVQPLRLGRFEMWLHFLEHGCLPVHAAAPGPATEWQRLILESLASDQGTPQRLRQLLCARPAALERLVKQHDEAFLRHLLSVYTGHAHEDLAAAIRQSVTVIVRALQTLAARTVPTGSDAAPSVGALAKGMLRILTGLLPELKTDPARKAALKLALIRLLEREGTTPPILLRRLMQVDFWRVVFREIVTPQELEAASTRMAGTLRDDPALRELFESPSSVRQAPLSAKLLRQLETRLLGLLARALPALKADVAQRDAVREQLRQALEEYRGSPAGLIQWMTSPGSWRAMLQRIAAPEAISSIANRIPQSLRDSVAIRNLLRPMRFIPEALPWAPMLRQLEVSVWRILLDEAIARGYRSDTPGLLARALQHPALREWQTVVLRTLAGEAQSGESLWRRILEAAIQMSAEPLRETHREQPPRRFHEPASTPSKQAGEHDRQPDRAKDQALLEGVRKKQEIPVTAEDLHYITNAGVILLHPFLPRFFRKLELTVEGEAFKDESSRGMAVCLVHHLATGELQTPEYQLVLPKLLCGMPLNAPLDHAIAIAADAQTEGESLLRAAIDHWAVLGRCSPDGLRAGFLQRAGKLERRPSGWFLQVERNTIDVLLDRLPWGIGVVKLPWMEDLLRVEWP